MGGRKEARPRDSFAPSSPSPGLIMKGDIARGSRVKPKGDSIVLKLSRTATYFDMHRARLLSVVHANWRGRPVIGKESREIRRRSEGENERPPVTGRLAGDGQAFSGAPARHFQARHSPISGVPPHLPLPPPSILSPAHIYM